MVDQISVIPPQDLESSNTITDADSFVIQRGNALVRVPRTTARNISGVASFATRGDLESALPNLGLAGGDIVFANGFRYRFQSGATAIPDLPGLVPDDIGYPEHFGAVGDSQGLAAPAPSGTDDGAALAAFFAWLPGNLGAFDAAKIYRTDRLFQISGDDYTLDLNNAILDARNAPETGTIINQTGSIQSTVTGISIATSTDSNQNQTVTVTATGHGRPVGDVVLLHSDNAVDIGYDPVNETRGQFSTVKTVADANTFTTVEPLYQTLPTNPRMAVINWRENFRWIGDFTILGRGRRAGADTNPALVGQIGVSFTYCRNFQIGRINTNRVDQQTVAVDNCVDFFVNKHTCLFDTTAPGSDGAIQYGVTFKNACTRGTVDGINATNGRHGAFDWTRNTNPGVGRDCLIKDVSAYGCWRSAVAMHGNALDCIVSNVRVKNCLDGVETRAPGWTITDVYGEDCRYVVRLTDDPKRTVLRNIRGDNVAYVIRFAAGLAGFIGVDPLKDIVIDGVFGNEVSNNTVFINAALPVFTQASAAVSAGTTTSMTVPDFSNAIYNNAGACTGWELVCDPDGGGSATEFTRTVTHTRVGGNNVFTWTTPVGTAPVAALATYSLRGFADDITITNVKSRNCAFADIAITPANHRNLIIDGVYASSESDVAQPVILMQATTDLFPREPKLSEIHWSNKRAPNISATVTDFCWNRQSLQETFQIPSDFATFGDAYRILGQTVPGDAISLQVESGHSPTSGSVVSDGDYSGYRITSVDAVVQVGTFTGDLVRAARASAPRLSAKFQANGRITVTLTGSVTVADGETITQAISGATGIVVGSTTGNTITLRNTDNGAFNGTNELSGSTSGALGPNSVPTDIAPVSIVNGYYLEEGSRGHVDSGAGVDYTYDSGLVAYEGSSVFAESAEFNFAARAANLRFGSNQTIFNSGAHAWGGGSSIYGERIQCNDSGFYGVQASHGGVAIYRNCDAQRSWRHGIRGSDAGLMDAEAANVSGSARDGDGSGVRAFEGSVVSFVSGNASNCAGSAFRATGGGIINGGDCTATNPGTQHARAENGGRVLLSGATLDATAVFNIQDASEVNIFGVTGATTLTLVIANGGKLTRTDGTVTVGAVHNYRDGVTFGTGTDVLNRYQEGSWTPVYRAGGTDFDSITYDDAVRGDCRYRRVGDMVFVEGGIRTDSVTVGSASGSVLLAGLPFAVANRAFNRGSFSIGFANGFSAAHPNAAYLRDNVDGVVLGTLTGGAFTSLAPSDLNTGTDDNWIMFSGFYITDEN